MGDRATVQLHSGKTFSPILYFHWAGHEVPEILKAAAPVMRQGDVSYAFARLVGVAHTQTEPEQALSLGVYSVDEIQREDDQGDSGHFLIDVDTGAIEHFCDEPMKNIEPLKLYAG